MLDRLHAKHFALETIVDDEGESRLALKDLQDTQLSPLFVDFTSGALLHRLKHGLSKNQPLAKALGLKSLTPEHAPFVIDATAGLGTDTLVMAALGCRVRAIERSDVIYELLFDGKNRLDEKVQASEDEALILLSQRFSFEHGDSKEIIGSLSEIDRPDVIYLDPMYPDEGRSKSALPKKPMQMFRRLLDGDDDAEVLWTLAMQKAKKRVVVKRPLKAPALGTSKPTHSFEGKTARLDLYLSLNQVI